jgi:type 1 fimbria pilin
VTLQVNYSSIAKNTERSKGGFTIKLLDCDENKEESFSESMSPFR